MPMADLSATFEAAGLKFLGHWYGGEKWSKFYITDLDGMTTASAMNCWRCIARR